MTIAAIDIDLRRVSMVTDEEYLPYLVGCPEVTTIITAIVKTPLIQTVLIEVASSLSYGRPWPRSRVAWALWNIHATERIVSSRLIPDILVAPSAVWTKGYSEEMRHELAKVKKLAKTKRDNHDLNECQAMIWSFKQQPSLWIPFRDYMKELK